MLLSLSRLLAPPLLFSSVFFLHSLSLMSVVCFNEFVVDTSPAPSSVCHSFTLPAGLKPAECKHTKISRAAHKHTTNATEALFFSIHMERTEKDQADVICIEGDAAARLLALMQEKTWTTTKTHNTHPLHTCSYTSMYIEDVCGALVWCSCSNALIISIPSLLINDPSVPSDWCSTSIPFIWEHVQPGLWHNNKCPCQWFNCQCRRPRNTRW